MNERNKQSARRCPGSSTHQEFHADAPLVGQICIYSQPTPVTLQVFLQVTMAGLKKSGTNNVKVSLSSS